VDDGTFQGFAVHRDVDRLVVEGEESLAGAAAGKGFG
jgi:hypothetical protein